MSRSLRLSVFRGCILSVLAFCSVADLLAQAPEVAAKLADVEREVDRLRKAGQNNEAEKFAAHLSYFRDRIHRKVEAKAFNRPQLHVIGVYGGSNPVVDVTATDGPITLALCAYNQLEWTVRLAKGANVQRVVVGGQRHQKVTGLPKEVPVEIHAADAGSEDGFYAYAKNQDQYRFVVQQLRKLTGLEITTFQGRYSYKDKPFIVGPESTEWETQRILAELAPIHQLAMAHDLVQRREAVRELRFKAVHRVQLGNHHETTSAFGDFTPLGPVASSLVPVSGFNDLTVDPKGPTYYGLGNEVSRIDWRTKQAVKLPLDADLPKFSWPGGLAFDTKRRRLVVTGGGCFYGYGPDDNQWAVLGKLNGVHLQSLTYSADEDCFYGLVWQSGDERRGKEIVFQLNPNGAVLRQIVVNEDLRGTRLVPRHHQVVAAGGHLVLISEPTPNLFVRGEPFETVVHVIDPRTGKTLYSGVSEPHPGKQTFVLAELDKLWETLLTGDDSEADLAMWKMAAGAEPVVAFLRKQFPPIPVPHRQRVEQWIAQLSDDQFAVRDKAFTELQRLEGIIETDLVVARKKANTIEVERRLDQLLRQIQQPQSQDPQLRREQRAIRVLARIGSSVGVDHLLQLASGPPGAFRTRQAELALQHLARGRH